MTIPRHDLLRLFIRSPTSSSIEPVLFPSSSDHPVSCRLLTKEELLSKYANRLALLGHSSSRLQQMTREELCYELFPSSQGSFRLDKCLRSPQSTLASLRLLTGTPIPKEYTTKETKPQQCSLLQQSIEHTYSSEPVPLFSVESLLTRIQEQTGMVALPHQTRVATHLLHHRGLLAVHRTGTGKTYTAILSILLLRAKYPHLRIVVMVPATLKENFSSQMIKFGTSIQQAQVELYSMDEYHSFYRQSEVLPSFEHTFLILDEAHNLRSDIRINQQQELTQSQTIFSIMSAAAQAFRVLLLTATPFVNSLYDINNLMAMVKGIPPLPTTHRSVDLLQPHLLSRSEFQTLVNQDKLVDYMRCHVSVYAPLTTDDFPELLVMPPVVFTMGPEYYDRYHKIEVGGGDSEIAKALGASSEGLQRFFSGLRRAVNALDGAFSPKIDWVIDFITREAAEGRKSVVFSNWKFAGMNLIRKRLDQMVALDPSLLSQAGYVYITGELPLDIRAQFKDLYNAGQAKILLISRAGSEGLDLTNTRNVIILESNWNPSADLQIIGRAVRYKSHHSLPPEQRSVKVWRLLMQKPQAAQHDKMKSIDQELYDLSYHIKAPLGNQLMEWLKEASIEENNCDIPPQEERPISTPPSEKIAVSEPEPDSIFREEEYEYIAPEASALITPQQLTTQQVAKLAGLPPVVLKDDEWM